MPASIRIIKIVKDKIGPMGEEKEAYTAELEVEAESAKDLERELLNCPYGEQLMALLKRAEFIPEAHQQTEEEMKEEAQKETEELQKREEFLRDEGRQEIRTKYLNYLRKKRDQNPNNSLTDQEERKAAEGSEEKEEPQTDRDEQDYHGILPFGGNRH